MSYTDTSLWKNSLADNGDGFDELRKSLRNAFETARKNASDILSKIGVDFPSLTVHNITHIDALWQVGSVIAGEGYTLNPLEGFVLGGAFLMHDMALSYDAVGGRETLRETTEWKDFYADYERNTELGEKDKKYEADFRTIRYLHAKYAEKLYEQQFIRDDRGAFYIIEDETLRKHLGPIICKIAASHHMYIDDVAALDTQFAVLSGFPQEWRVNPMKLACLLRCADAGHIDGGRAPDYLLKLLTVNGVSRDHWTGQNHLSQIDVDKKNAEKVIICSNINFKETDFAAWNVIYDAVQVLDHEIRVSNDLLAEKNISPFAIKGVRGVESRQMLSKYVQTEGWTPCDANVHISNVEGLIKNLGGEQLYGENNKLEVVLRELIQNARDAIVARGYREEGVNGKITVEIDKDGDTTWVTVKDNGVGMSLHTIKDYFLNFGSCFWGSDLTKSEYPGLNASEFKPVGKFGIGFFSIFMVASEVIVETRKYDAALDDCIRLKFHNGLCLRPIVSKCRGKSDISTIIKFSLDEKKCKWEETKRINPGVVGEQPFIVPFSSVLSRLTAGLDVDVYYSELKTGIKKIHTNIFSKDLDRARWLKDITYAEYHGGSAYSDYIDKNHHRVRPIYNGRFFKGYAALNTLYGHNSFFGVTTVGGLHNINQYSNSSDFMGCMLVEPETAKRDGKVDKKIMVDWAKEQYEILVLQGLTDMDKLWLPYILGEYGIDMTDIMKIRVRKKTGPSRLYELSELLTLLKNKMMKLVLPLSSLSSTPRVDNFIDVERTLEKMDANELLFCVETNSNFLDLSGFDPKIKDINYNIMQCIQLVAISLSLKISVGVVKNKTSSRLSSNGNAIVINVM